jgi:hypothetical protein
MYTEKHCPPKMAHGLTGLSKLQVHLERQTHYFPPLLGLGPLLFLGDPTLLLSLPPRLPANVVDVVVTTSYSNLCQQLEGKEKLRRAHLKDSGEVLEH